jgi:asparagine synthase (glutamine-hydrolysing)
MCGIIGHISILFSEEKEWLIEARDKMKHRGPDSGGYYKSKCERVEFGQRRLSILDLSTSANQPYIVVMGGFEYSITFNGEIYNFQELRKKLTNTGVTFHTDSDTEVVLRAYIQWGKNCLDQFEGMFSFAIYDGKKSQVFLARDIVGEKPLYFSNFGNELYFASEFLSLHSHPRFEKAINLDRIYQYLELGYLPKDKSFSKLINKLKPGHYFVFDLNNGETEYQPFHQISVEKNKTINHQSFDSILVDVIEKELRSDVPVGVMLSGGIDSSIIACKTNKASQNVTNFTVDFGDNYDELENAKLISRTYGVKHEILTFKELDLFSFDKIIGTIDEPIADSSFIPTYLITEMIKLNGCTVVLGGDGADEIFGGYSLYAKWQKILNLSTKLPLKILGKTVNCFKPLIDFNDSKVLKWLRNLDFNNSDLPNIRSVFSESEMKKIFKEFNYNYAEYYTKELKNYNNSVIENLMLFDLYNYFSSNILLKNDRSSMQNSVELRAPFLHRNIIEFGFNQISLNEKLNDNNTKVFLKKYGKELFPKGYNFHTKRGFNFTDNLIKNKEWEAYFREKISILSEKLNWNAKIADKLILLGEQKKINFIKLYSIIVLSNWITKNELTINE